MAQKFEIHKDMPVFLKPVGNAERRSTDIKRHFVKKIGRKYFETWNGENDRYTIKFRLDDFQQETGGYSADYEIYPSEQDIINEREKSSLESFFKHTVFGGFGSTNLTLDQLRRMKEIVDEAK